MDLESWEKQKLEAEGLSKKLNFPIIVGLEMHLKHLGEEVLLFGAEACRSWFTWKKIHTVKYSVLYQDWYEIQKDRERHHPFALILAHPYLMREDPEFYSTLDGYEITNGGLYWGDSYVRRMERLMPQAAQYHGMDVHYEAEMSYRCNEIADEDLLISNDLDLITFLKTRRNTQ